MVIALFLECFPLQPTRSDRHELVENNELQSQFEDVTEVLDGVAETKLIEVYQDHAKYVEGDIDHVDVHEVNHHSACAYARFVLKQFDQRRDVYPGNSEFH